jgi:hypothetical protein
MTEQQIELGGVVLEAYVQHRIALAHVEWEAELQAAEQRAWEPVRQHLARTRNSREWTERRDAALAAREQRRQEILAGRAKESA